jgi:hypothetical protein
MSQQMKKKTKIPLFVVIFYSIDILIWISAKVEHKFCFPKKSKKNSRIFNSQKSKECIYNTDLVPKTLKEA